MSWKTYPEYKDSGIEWLGKIPKEWSIVPLKYLVAPRGDAVKTGPFGSQLLSADMISGSVKVYNQRNVLDKDFQSGENYITEDKYVELKAFTIYPGDLLITTRGTIGHCELFPSDAEQGILHPCLMRVQPDSRKIIPKYLAELIQNSFLVKTQLALMSNATTIEVIYSDSLKRVWIPVPKCEEQNAIAAFLDRETERIDALIAKKERQIELLQEKRAALISHAVTKGLNPDVKMKDSGIKWLGEIPEHWEVLAIKRITSIPITDGPHETPEILDEGIPFISAEAIKNDKIDFAKMRGYISLEDHARFSRKYKPERGDIYLIKSGATTGNVAFVNTDDDFNIWSPLAAIRPDPKKAITPFVFFFMKSKNFFQSIELGWSYGTQQNIGMNVIENIPIALPPLKEQRAIATLLDSETGQIDVIQNKVQESIVKLREYRTALISAAVTGKIDVRGNV